MDARRRLRWLIILSAIISLLDSGCVLGTSHENQSGGRRKLASTEGFISLDCGIPPDSFSIDDDTGIDYVSDAGFIDTGIIYDVCQEYTHEVPNQQLKNVRSFPEGERNCYTLPVGKGIKYLIRAWFMYGNYDAKHQLPIFTLFLGVDEWVKVNISDASTPFRKEIIHIATRDRVDVCLVNNGSGTPFISALELRQLNDLIYDASEPGSLLLLDRLDYGSGQKEGNLIREKDDVYDRIWRPYADLDFWEPVNSSLVSPSLSSSNYRLPGNVMATASTPINASEDWFTFLDIDADPSQDLYVFIHLAEFIHLQGEIREFKIYSDSGIYGPVAPRYPFTDTYTVYSMRGSRTDYSLWISLERTARSTLPPIINAMEVYMIKEFSQASTQQDDVDAMKMIKSGYSVSRNWQGDPCLPVEYQWHGLSCSLNTSPAIISMNLSSSNLSGDILLSFSSLKSLQSLDLSYNNLTGTVPEYFAYLPSLIILNLKGNNLTGSVPQAVVDKFKDGTLSLGENPHLCQSDSCQQGINKKKKKKKNILILVLISIVSVFVLIIVFAALAVIIRKFKRRETRDSFGVKLPKQGQGELESLNCQIESQKEAATVEMASELSPREGTLKTGNSEFTYSEVVNITNNFSHIVGKGGFGPVFLGKLADGTQVAVKLRSQSSRQDGKALRAEATLLTRVHHRNLVSLMGYCNDGTHMALIYEYMPNGSLQYNLLGRDTIDLNWEWRLQIGADAAQGLEYLHNGCKPPIVHRDMKSSNILLSEKLEAKISDFGMSRDLGTESGDWITTTPVGTPGYLDPEYHSTGILNKKSDVYSFGIVLLELITGQPAIKKPEGIHILRWVDPLVERGNIQSIVDPRLQGDFNPNSAWKALELALACAAPTGRERPDMSQVVAGLKECLEIEMASKKIPGLPEESPMVLSIELAPHAR